MINPETKRNSKTHAEMFAEWLEKGPKLALAAGCYVEIKVKEDDNADQQSDA